MGKTPEIRVGIFLLSRLKCSYKAISNKLDPLKRLSTMLSIFIKKLMIIKTALNLAIKKNNCKNGMIHSLDSP